MTRVCCIADLHGHLPAIPEDIDLLLVAGDILPHYRRRDYAEQYLWLERRFGAWLEPIAGRCPVVAVAGNHDWVFQDRPQLLPELPWTYMEDSSAPVEGMIVHGSPWSVKFGDWAYMKEDDQLHRHWERIPEDTDILLVHGPPFGFGDTTYDGRIVGSQTLTNRLEVVRPRLVVCGHIHEGHGTYTMGETTVVNASIRDQDYNVVHAPTIIEL